MFLPSAATIYRWSRRSLTTDSAKTLVHALIASRLNCCNSVLYQVNVHATQTLHNCSQCYTVLLDSLGESRSLCHITPTLRDHLHWLPVPRRIIYKLCTLIYKLRRNQRWRRGAVRRVSDLRSRGRGFESWSGTRRKNSWHVSHTYVPLFTKQYKLVPAKGR